MAETTVGRTHWDFVTETAGKLGPGVLILAGIIFGFYQFQDQANEFRLAQKRLADDAEKERRNAVQQSQQLLHGANERLISTYAELGKMNTSMIQNVGSAVETLNSLQQKIAEYETFGDEQARKAREAADAQRRAEEARDAARQEMEAVRAQARAERRKLQDEQKRKQLDWVERTGPFQERVRELVAALHGDDPERARELAASIRTEYLVDPRALLAAWREDPRPENARRLTDLAGLALEKWRAVMTTDSPLPLWLEGTGDGDAFLLGLDEVGAHGIGRIVVVGLEKGRSLDVQAARDLRVMTAPSLDDWDRTVMVGFVWADGAWEPVEETLPPEGPLATAAFFAALLEGEFHVAAGDDPARLAPPAFAAVRGEIPPAVYEQVEGFARLRDRVLRVERFRADRLVPTLTGRRADLRGLRETAIRTLRAAVGRDEAGRRAVQAPAWDVEAWGRLAARVLEPRVVFDPTVVIEDKAGNEVSLRFRFGDGRPREAALRYQRTGDAWKLIAFEEYGVGYENLPAQMPEEVARR